MAGELLAAYVADEHGRFSEVPELLVEAELPADVRREVAAAAEALAIQVTRRDSHKSRELGMCTFDQALYELYNKGYISYDEAIRNADSANGLRLQIKLRGDRKEPGSGSGTTAADLSMAIEEEEEEEEDKK